MNSQTASFVASARFHALADTASKNGGMWVSAGGGTANVVAGVISRSTGVSFDDAHHALNVMGGDDWYADLAHSQPHRWDDLDAASDARWDAATVAKAACRKVVA